MATSSNKKPAPQQNKKPAAAQQAAPKQPSREVARATGGEGALSAAAAALAEQYAGAGVSHAQEDNIIPLVYLLQSNSPQVVRGHEKHIDGAQAGDMWLRNEPEGENIISGEDGMVAQPCFFGKSWIEWMPNRGGFVTRHAERPEDAELQDVETDNGTEVKRWVRPNGNVVVETREYAVLVHVEGADEPLPYVIPFSGTGHTPAKQWMGYIRKKKLPSGKDAPSFACKYRLTPKLRTKGPNSWYQYEISEVGWVENAEDIQRGAALYEAFQSGAKQAGQVEDVGSGDTEHVGGDVDE
jgi:hypothetical protein